MNEEEEGENALLSGQSASTFFSAALVCGFLFVLFCKKCQVSAYGYGKEFFSRMNVSARLWRVRLNFSLDRARCVCLVSMVLLLLWFVHSGVAQK